MSRKNTAANIGGDISTRQKILGCAVDLFAQKGYTESTIRELADAAGLKGASIYNHFPSKNAILENILEDYMAFNSGAFNENEAREKLVKNPGIGGILDCYRLIFPQDSFEYFLKTLYVLLQEQHRNPVIQDFVSRKIILQAEGDTLSIFKLLKELKIIREDVDPDPWAKTISSLMYAFASRMLLGIGDARPDFAGMGLTELIRFHYALLLKQDEF